ncbi:hypothetical protein P692DRAFT_20762294, partial [Suillus brevipes Sb2]
EEVEEDNDSWLDDIALFFGESQAVFRPYLSFHTTFKDTNESISTSITFAGLTSQDSTLHNIFKFLTTLQAPSFNSVTARQRFVKKTAQFFVRNG